MEATLIEQIEELELAEGMFEDSVNTSETRERRREYVRGIAMCREKLARLRFKLTNKLNEQWALASYDLSPADVYFEDDGEMGFEEWQGE